MNSARPPVCLSSVFDSWNHLWSGVPKRFCSKSKKHAQTHATAGSALGAAGSPIGRLSVTTAASISDAQRLQ